MLTKDRIDVPQKQMGGDNLATQKINAGAIEIIVLRPKTMAATVHMVPSTTDLSDIYHKPMYHAFKDES